MGTANLCWILINREKTGRTVMRTRRTSLTSGPLKLCFSGTDHGELGIMPTPLTEPALVIQVSCTFMQRQKTRHTGSLKFLSSSAWLVKQRLSGIILKCCSQTNQSRHSDSQITPFSKASWPTRLYYCVLMLFPSKIQQNPASWKKNADVQK